MFAGSVCCFYLEKQQGDSRSLNGSDGKEGKRTGVHSGNRKCSIVPHLTVLSQDIKI